VQTILAASTVALSLLVSSAGAQTPPPPVALTYIRVGHLYDPASGRYLDNATLVVANQRIQSVEGPGFQPPAGAHTMDLSSEYVLPDSSTATPTSAIAPIVMRRSINLKALPSTPPSKVW
jgi:hypothetical protein